MTVRVFMVGTVITALGSSAIWLAVINYLDPQRAAAIGFFLFFLSLFLATASITALIGYAVRRFISRHIFAAYAVRTSLRQGVLLGIFLDLLLLLQLINLYVWWLALIIVVLFVTIELIFLSYDRARKLRSAKPPR